MRRVTIELYEKEYQHFKQSIKDNLLREMMQMTLGGKVPYEEYKRLEQEVHKKADEWFDSHEWFIRNHIKYLVDRNELKIESWGQQLYEVWNRCIWYPVRVLYGKATNNEVFRIWIDSNRKLADFIHNYRLKRFLKKMHKGESNGSSDES